MVSSRTCIACQRDRTAEWRKESAEHMADYKKRYSAENWDAIYATMKAWKVKNPDKVKRSKDAEYRRNKVKRLASMKVWRAANLNKIKAAESAKRAANPDRYRAYKRNYKIRKRRAPGSHTGEDIQMLLKAQSGKCAYCRVKLGKKYHVDHIVALSKGGANDRTNLQILCARCNQTKSAKDPIVFAQSLGMLL